MENYLLKSLSPQAVNVYRFLGKAGLNSAKSIGKALKVFPHAVYPATEELLGLGLIEKKPGRPTQFFVKPPEDALESCLSVIRQNFGLAFNNSGIKPSLSHPLKLEFIHSRKELFEYVAKDIVLAKDTVDLIVSGFEVPAKIILAYQQAIKRKVQIRVIVQHFDGSSEEMFDNWQRAGATVKYYKNMKERILVLDKRIAYTTSFNDKDKETALGIRFDYVPFAQMMDELFEKRWALAKEISGVLR